MKTRKMNLSKFNEQKLTNNQLKKTLGGSGDDDVANIGPRVTISSNGQTTRGPLPLPLPEPVETANA